MNGRNNDLRSETEVEFRTLKFDFNYYQFYDEVSNISGILRVAVLPLRITKVENSVDAKPNFRMIAVNIVSFINKGKKGEPSKLPLNFTNVPEEEKIDITEKLSVLSEPYNIFVTTGVKPYYALRYKTSVNKAEIIKNIFDSLGDPIIQIFMSPPTLSYSYHSNNIPTE